LPTFQSSTFRKVPSKKIKSSYLIGFVDLFFQSSKRHFAVRVCSFPVKRKNGAEATSAAAAVKEIDKQRLIRIK
jgi:hypothetical protein